MNRPPDGHDLDQSARWEVALHMAGTYVASGRYDDAAAVMQAHLDGERRHAEWQGAA